MLVHKLLVDSLCGSIVWRKCKKKDGDKELERGFKRSNILGKIGCKKKKLNTIVLGNHVVLLVGFVCFNKGYIQFLFPLHR